MTKIIEDPGGDSWNQAPFDSRITTFPMLSTGSGNTAKQLSQGYIREVLDSTTATPGVSASMQARQLTFLYNPSSLSVSHQISTSDAAADPSYRTPVDQSIGTILGATGTSVGFTLLFDRTYEVSNPGNFGTRLAELGCAVDVNALYAITGILNSMSPTDISNLGIGTSANGTLTSNPLTANNSKAEAIAQSVVKQTPQNPNNPLGKVDTSYVTQATIADLTANDITKQLLAAKIVKALQAANLSTSDLPTSPPSTASPTVTNLLPAGDYFGYMQMKRVIAVFGTQRKSWNPALEYYGWINSMNIEYTHWTQNMVPVRCAVDISMNLWGTPVDKVTSVANGGFFQ